MRSSLPTHCVSRPSHTGWQMMVLIPSLLGFNSQKLGYEGARIQAPSISKLGYEQDFARMAPLLAPARKEHLNPSVNLIPDS